MLPRTLACFPTPSPASPHPRLLPGCEAHLTHTLACFLICQASAEEQKFKCALQREKEAFEQLVFQKSHLLIPADFQVGLGLGLGFGFAHPGRLPVF